jgi:4-hydroxybenzoate polyprenyltransferase
MNYLPLVAAFSFSAVSYSAALREGAGWPAASSVAVAFLTSLLFFLLLRIADEFKDAETDARWRPYRAVPRGLVTLAELRWVGIGAALVQLGLALSLDARLLVLLAAAWAYFGLMSNEFFASSWLRRHAVVYMLSHMLIMPLIDLYATATDWLPAEGTPHAGLAALLLVSFFTGIVIEVGRKIRAADDEEEGVETYSALWGRPVAVAVWLTAAALAAASAFVGGLATGVAPYIAAVALSALGAMVVVGLRFTGDPTSRNASRFEPFSGVWAIAVYLSLGLLPHLVR